MIKATHINAHTAVLWSITTGEHADGTGQFWEVDARTWQTSEVNDDFLTQLIPLSKPKPVYYMKEVALVPARDYWPTHKGIDGQYVAEGSKVNENGDYIAFGRTSLLVGANFGQRYIETLNSIYIIV